MEKFFSKSLVALVMTGVLASSACDNAQRNAYMLAPDSAAPIGIANNPLNTAGYDWQWHNLSAISTVTGKERRFFVEDFVINPGLGGDQPILGQLPANQAAGIKPSYGMVKAGTWGEDGVEINNFYGAHQVVGSTEVEDLHIGPNYATETALFGSVSMSKADAAAHPEYMSDAGTMSWNLTINKTMRFDMGYATSDIPRDLNLFTMAWEVAGLKAEYTGSITYNGEVFTVTPDTSYGYADKNYGHDFTNPWIWFSSTRIVDANGQYIRQAALDVGGGRPELLNLPLWKTALVIFHINDKQYDFNFTKLWQNNSVKFNVTTTDPTSIIWDIAAENGTNRIEILGQNPKSKMLFVDYENPQGQHNHKQLWNGGDCTSTIKVYDKAYKFFTPYWKLVGTYYGSYGGCEWGAY
jgi:hypothetical protein